MTSKLITIFTRRSGLFYRGIKTHKISQYPINNIYKRCLSLVSANGLHNYDTPVPYSLCFYSSQYQLENKMKNKETEKNVETVINTTNINLSSKEKLKKAVKEYGSTVIIFHVGISLISLGTCYLLISMGLDIAGIFESVGMDEWFKNSKIATNAGTFAVAYGIHKVFAPVRIGITLASVPLIVRYLRRIGFLKK